MPARPGSGWSAVVAEDDITTRLLITALLTQEGFSVSECDDGRRVVELVRELEPDLVVLDVGLPSQDGVEACRAIRAFSDTYVIMVTGLASEADMLVAFAAGCDDYMSKPFSPAELVARIRALQRRVGAPREDGNGIRAFGPLQIDLQAREVVLAGRQVELTRIEFDLLAALSGAPRLAFTRTRLIEEVWGADWFGNDHLVDVHISNLRRKLGSPEFIATVRGVGYRMGAGA
jgi:DNA-binding response OmpR family regulator